MRLLPRHQVTARRRPHSLLASCALAPLVLLAACSSGSGTGAAPTSNPTASSAPAATSTTALPDAGGTITDLAAKTATADVKITYQSALGPSATLAQDGKGKSSVLSGGKLLLSDGARVISCDGSTPSAKCTDLGPPRADDALTQLISGYAGLSTLKQTNLGVTSAQTLLGRSASCVTFKASDYFSDAAQSDKLTAAATVSVCVDDDSGFVLKIALTDRGQTVNEVLATKIGPSGPGDFVPPSTPVALPTTTVPAG